MEAQRSMKVVILCGGIGARLKEQTEFIPKPMVEIGGKPILWHIMKIYAHYGFNEFILCLGYKGEVIKSYFLNYKALNNDFTICLDHGEPIKIHSRTRENAWKVTLVDTGEKTLKGGRLKRVEKYATGDHIMVTYGDGVADIDIPRLLDFHLAHGKMATVTGINPHARFGKLKLKGDKVLEFFEKPRETGEFVNGGFFVFKREIFRYLEDREDCDLEYGALEKIASMGELMTYKHFKFWACLDTIRDAEYLEQLWRSNKAEWKLW